MTRIEKIISELNLNKIVQEGIKRHPHFPDRRAGFIDGAQWMQKTMIDKACEWVENHIFDFPWYDNEHGDFSSKDVANALRKAMEE